MSIKVTPAFYIVIPARYESSRFPGKLMRLLAGMPLIQHVYERVKTCGATQVWVATDSDTIANCARAFGASVCMTPSHCKNGTERIATVAEQYQWQDNDIIVNIQGDEPFFPKENIVQVVRNLTMHPQAKVATLYQAFESVEDIFNPDMVKVTFDSNQYALTFSRAPIPWDRKWPPAWMKGHSAEAKDNPREQPCVDLKNYHLHLGIYAYRASTLREYQNWPVGQLESLEGLEQLRVLEQGAKIHVDKALCQMQPGINSERDLAEAQAYIDKQVLTR